jgi:chromosome segregation ATPase
VRDEPSCLPPLHCVVDQRFPTVCSTPHSAGRVEDLTSGLRQQLEDLSARVEQLELGTQETDGNVMLLFDKVDELSGAVAAQEDSFTKRLAEALASVREQLTQNNSLVAELCAKVQSQEEQLQQLMAEREVVPVQVETSGVVTGESRGYLSRAAKAAAKAAGLS